MKDRAYQLGQALIGGNHTYALATTASCNGCFHSTCACSSPADLGKGHCSASHITSALVHPSHQLS